MRDYAHLVVWRESAKLAADVADHAKLVRGPARSSAAAQLVRAAESIPANLVEGLGRGVSRDCVRFLRMARSSAIELDHHLRQAEFSRRLTPETVERLMGPTRRVRFLLRRLQESVERRLGPDS